MDKAHMFNLGILVVQATLLKLWHLAMWVGRLLEEIVVYIYLANECLPIISIMKILVKLEIVVS